MAWFLHVLSSVAQAAIATIGFGFFLAAFGRWSPARTWWGRSGFAMTGLAIWVLWGVAKVYWDIR